MSTPAAATDPVPGPGEPRDPADGVTPEDRPRPRAVEVLRDWRRRARLATRVRLADRLGARWGGLSRAVRFPIPGREPWRRAEVHVGRHVALGDVLLCTPALRRLKELNPGCRVTFFTSYGALLEGLPFVDEVRPSLDHTPQTVWLGYEGSLPPRRHLARVLGDPLGLEVIDVRPSCALDAGLLQETLDAWSNLPAPRVVLSRRASAHTPNKDWPAPYWDELVARLLAWASVVEVGVEPRETPSWAPDRYLNLTGRLPLRRLVAAVAAADLHVGPISGPVHLAAAFHVPSAVIYGGYEPPECTAYEGNVAFFSPEPCAPCWLTGPCPVGRVCLSRIAPARVEAALADLWAGRQARRKLSRAAGPVPSPDPEPGRGS